MLARLRRTAYVKAMQIARFEAPAPGAPRSPPEDEPEGRRAPEPMFNAPWTIVLLTAVIVAGYAIQSRFPLQLVADAWAFSPSLLGEGEWERLITSQFLHGDWMHALMNAGFALAFGTPVARFFGMRPMGVVLFFAFYLVCGVLSSLAYAAVHQNEHSALMGASGAVSGFMGAAARLMAGRGWIGPILSRPVLSLGGVWIAINLVIGIIGTRFLPVAEGFGIAWEAHIAGFVAGVLLFSPFAWLAWMRR